MTDAPCYAAVVVRQDGGANAYGPCTAQAELERMCTLLGFTDATVVTTRAVTLTPPRWA